MFAARKQPGKKDAPTLLYTPPVKKTEWVQRVVAAPQTRQTLDERLKQNKLKRRREREAAEEEESEKYRKISAEASASSSAVNGNAGPSVNGKLRRATSANGSKAVSSDDEDDGVLESGRWKVDNEEADVNEHPLYAKKYIGPLKVKREHLAATAGSALQGNTISGRRMVENNRAGYEQYFPDLQEDTIATLEYPGTGGSEEFLLLRPKVKDGRDYHPLHEIINVVRIVCDHFLQPEQALSLFRHVKTTSSFDFLNQSAPSLLRKNSRTDSPAPDLLSITRASTPGSDVGTPEPSGISNTPADQIDNTSIESLAASFGKDSVVRSLDKAFRRKNGAAFLSALAWYNAGIQSLKQSKTIHANIEELGSTQGVPEAVWQTITLQCYERTVGPRIDKLKKYAAFSDNTYGELLAPLLAHIAGTIGLNERKVLVDLGSGVGNCCAQLSLATGCASYGIENQLDASDMAREQTIELQARCRQWGLQCGSVEVHKADFLESPQIVEPILAKADVILVNNFVFSPVTNERLSLMFPALKEGAQIVSLRPFCERPGAAPISDRNENAIESILIQSKPIEFGRRHVSWTDEGGRYYIATVDRSRRKAFEEAKELNKMQS